jgi:hypothetical protein
MMRSLSLFALVALSTVAEAQDRPTVLGLPSGPRALGVGDAFVAGRSPEVLFYNPAQIAIQPGVAVSGQRYSEFAGSGSMAGVFALPVGAIGIGIQFLEFRDEPPGGSVPARFDALSAGGSAIASSLAASLALNLPAIKGIRSGVTAKMAHEQVGDARDDVIAADIGIARDVFGRGTLAFSAQNLGPAVTIDGVEAKLPTRYTLGGAVQAPPFATFFDLAATASVSYLRDGALVPAGGVEITYVPLEGWGFTARVGGRRVEDRSDATPLTFGAGVSLDRVSLDYAFYALDAGGASHRLGLRVRGKRKSPADSAGLSISRSAAITSDSARTPCSRRPCGACLLSS